MKDFDHFFRKRLEGERPFARRDENWRQMSRRLDAFDSGIQGKGSAPRHWPKMLWQAAAFTAAAAATWMGLQNHALHTENQALHEQLSISNPQPVAVAPVAPIPGAPAVSSLAPGPAASDNFQQEGPSKGVNTAEKTFETANNKVFENKKSTAIPSMDAEKTAAIPASGTENAGSASNTKTAGNTGAVPTIGIAPITNAVPNTVRPDNTSNVVSSSTPVSIPNGEALDSVAAVASRPDNSAPFQADSTQGAIAKAPADTLQTPAVAEASATKDSIHTAAAATPPAPIIQPVRRPVRFRVGIQGVVGSPAPHEKGVSWMTGEGLLAEVRVFGGFWVGASADWLRFDVSTEQNPPRFHLPDEPHYDPHGGPQQHPFELTKVETDQRQRRYSASVRYAVPLRGWIKPSLHVAYVWAQTPSAIVSYRFEEEQHGPFPGTHDPEYFTKRSENQWFKNIWRFGAGMEVEVKNWAFGLSADYDKSFASNDPLFDALLIRAGATYQF